MLRRTAFRALSAKPSASLLPKTRSIVTLNQNKFRPAQQWTVSSFQRRFASDEVAGKSGPVEAVEAVEEAIEEIGRFIRYYYDDGIDG